jgi:ABC-type transporter Mla maintaining outer membrane lipid asymmetry ATPase subunit MlaF
MLVGGHWQRSTSFPPVLTFPGASSVIEVRRLTKRYGDNLAVDDLTFDVAPGVVTGFLGPNCD